MMEISLEWIVALYSMFLAILSIKKIFNKPSELINYTILLIIIFNSLPIMLDLLIGKPNYNLFSWYNYFEISTQNETVNIIYCLIIIVSLFVLHLYSFVKNRYTKTELKINNSSVFKGKVLVIISCIPIVFFIIAALISDNPLEMFQYTSNFTRGFNNIFMEISTIFELLGIFAITVWYFEKNRTKKETFLLILFYFVLAWINAKRYIVVTELLLFGYFYLNTRFKQRGVIRYRSLILVVGVSIIIFYFAYLLAYKTIGEVSFDFLYLTYRIDFGRDDVTKFVIYREVIEQLPILDYRGQTVLSTILFFIPRSIWPDKPFPHYRYLTSSLYNTSVMNIPSGMTPSIFETVIANFGLFIGIVVTPLLLMVLVSKSNKSYSLSRRALYLLLLSALLTQSLDSIMVVLLLLPLGALAKFIKLKL